MPLHVTIAIVAFLLCMSCIFSGNAIVFAMIEKVNAKLPGEVQVGYLGFYPGKLKKIRWQYRYFYPGGKLDKILSALVAGMFAGFAGFALLLLT
jgi:hypothetical protein